MITIVRALFVITALLMQPVLASDIYRCTDSSGEVVFQGEPCRDAAEVKLDIRFAEQPKQDVKQLVTGSWCEIGTSTVAGGSVQQDSAIRKTWTFTERQMVQQISQGQRQDTFRYPIRQSPGSFVVDHPAFGSGQVNWQVRSMSDNKLVIAAYGGFTHLTAGDCEMVLAGTQN